MNASRLGWRVGPAAAVVTAVVAVAVVGGILVAVNVTTTSAATVDTGGMFSYVTRALGGAATVKRFDLTAL